MQELIAIGEKRFFDLKNTINNHQYSGDNEVDVYFNDLDKYSHIYILACLMNRRIKAERAWKIPYYVCKHFNAFDMNNLSKISYEDIKNYFLTYRPHKHNEEMSKVFYKGVQKIHTDYNDDISQIWKNKPSSANVIYKLLEFNGCGIKIATMATNILVREYGIELSDYFAIDISPDVHVKRIMFRLGLISDKNNVESIIYKAKELNPTFPGIIDIACWEIGRQYCHETNPECDKCPLKKCCKYKSNKNV